MMKAYLVLTILSVAVSVFLQLSALVDATPTPLGPDPQPRPHFAPATFSSGFGTGLREASVKKTDKQTVTETPVLSLDQFCELLQSAEQKTECLEFVRQHVKPVSGTQGQEEDNKIKDGFKTPLDLQVFVPSENSWYLQDSHNHKFLGKPLISIEKQPEDKLDVAAERERKRLDSQSNRERLSSFQANN